MAIGTTQLTYLDPVASSPLLDGFMKVSGLNILKITTHSAIAQENGRDAKVDKILCGLHFTFLNNKDFMAIIVKIAADIKKDIPILAFGFNIIFAPIWTASRDRSFAKGGENALGLNESDDDLIVVSYLQPGPWQIVDRLLHELFVSLLTRSKSRPRS